MYRIFLALTIIATGFVSCNNSTIETPITKIKGNIEGLNNQKLLLLNDVNIDTITTDSIGNFTFEKDIDKPQFANLRLGRKFIPLYLKNGFDLTISTTKADFGKEVKFIGKGSIENSLLSEKANLTTSLAYFPNIFKLDPDSFLAKSDSVKELFYNLASDYTKSKNLDSTFIETYNADVKYEQLSSFLLYKPYHKYFTQEESELPENIKDEVEKAIVDDDKFIHSKKYLEFMSNALRERYNDIEGNDENENVSEYLKWINTEIESQLVKNELYYNSIRYSITYVGEEDRDDMYSNYSKLNTDTKKQQKIDEIYKAFEKLRKGNAAPTWSYPDLNGKEYALTDFRGKYVYIDVWATWCGPCKREIPELAKLAKKYKGKDIVFVSVSVDDNKKAWEKMVKAENFDWIQIYAEKAWKSTIVKDNNINGIPRFMMVDREGNIVNVNAPAPSSEEITPLIDKLLAE